MIKDYNISRLRVIFTIWIIVFHSANQYIINNPLFNIHIHEELEFLQIITLFVLQGFVFISGLLMARGYLKSGKYHDKSLFCLDKAKRLLLPYIFWSCLLVALYPVSWIDVLCGAKHLWFLLMLFDVMVVAVYVLPILERTSLKSDIIIILSIVVISAFVNKYIGLHDIFRWKTALTYFAPFMMGIFTVKYQLDKLLLSLDRIRFYSLFVSVAALVVSFFFIHTLPYGLFYMFLPNYICFPLLYILFCRMFKFSETSPVENSIDMNSLGIYILHNFVGKYTLFYYVPSFVIFYDEHCVLAPICLFVMMFSLAWFVSSIMHKNKYTAMLLGS